MSNGYFDLSLYKAGGLQDDDFRRAHADGRLDELLGDLEMNEQRGTANIVNTWMAYYLFYRAFDSGIGTINSAYCQSGGNRPFYELGGSGPCLFNNIAITTLDSEPTVLDCQGGGYTDTSIPNLVTTDAAKRFITGDIVDHQVWSDGDGREAVHFRSRFLYLTQEAVSNYIRSIEVWFANDCDYSGNQQARVARARIKDAGGTPITISKTDNQVLLVEYTLTLVSV